MAVIKRKNKRHLSAKPHVDRARAKIHTWLECAEPSNADLLEKEMFSTLFWHVIDEYCIFRHGIPSYMEGQALVFFRARKQWKVAALDSSNQGVLPAATMKGVHKVPKETAEKLNKLILNKIVERELLGQ